MNANLKEYDYTDSYFKYTDAPPTDHQETYDEKIERYKEGWRREWDDER